MTLMTMIPAFLLLDETGSTAGALLGGAMTIVFLAIGVVLLIALWKVFVKAGQPGWAILIPLYNAYIMLKIAGKPGWWLLLLMIPFVNIVIAALVAINIAKAFGQSTAFGVVLLFLLCGIGYLMLGFGNYRYVGLVPAPAQ